MRLRSTFINPLLIADQKGKKRWRSIVYSLSSSSVANRGTL